MDFATEAYVREQRENFQPTYALYITFGVVFCIISVIPSAVIGTFLYDSVFLNVLSGAFVLIFVAIGVMFFIMGAKRKSGYEVLLAINPGAGENGVREDEEPQSELERECNVCVLADYRMSVSDLELFDHELAHHLDHLADRRCHGTCGAHHMQGDQAIKEEKHEKSDLFKRTCGHHRGMHSVACRQ